MNKKLRILHFADWQVSVRNSGMDSNRYDEFKQSINNFIDVVKDAKPDVIVCSGDVFEHEHRTDTNSDESKLFAKLLHGIVEYTKRIVIINGNHDVRQKNNAVVLDGENKRNRTDPIDLVVTAIDNEKISYYKHGGLYKDTIFDLTWCVWSQLDKFNPNKDQRNYNIWEHNDINDVKTKASIELFHDPFKGCKSFDRKASVIFTDYNITMGNFRCNTILAGDIHAPDIVRNGKKTFTYPSSMVMRNFGEGDYYDNYKMVINGNAQHGYNDIVFSIDNNSIETIEFKKLDNDVSRHTINLSNDFDYNNISMLNINPTEKNIVRIVCNGNLSEFTENEQNLVDHFKGLYNCEIHFDYAKDVINDTINVDDKVDFDGIIDNEQIEKMCNKYVDSIVDKTKTIRKEDKQRAKNMLKDMFMKSVKEKNEQTECIDFHFESFKTSYFMSFGEDVSLDFSGSINKIVGTNGVGKTTMLNFLRWMLKDRISANQNMAQKKYNYLCYFNDSSDSDVVKGELVFYVNKNKHILTKTLERKWKNNKPIRNREDSEKFISGTPVMSMKMKSDKFNSTDAVEITEYLDNLITFEELEMMAFVDQDSLSNLINMKTDNLNAIIMKNIGLGFMDELSKTFDSMKDEKMKNVVKHVKTVENFTDENETLENENAELSQNIDEKTDLLNVYGIDIEKVKKIIDENVSRLPKTDISIFDDKKVLDQKRNIVNENISNLKQLVHIKTEKKSLLVSLEELNKKLIVKKALLEQKNNEYQRLESSKTEKSNNLDMFKQLAIDAYNNVTVELNADIEKYSNETILLNNDISNKKLDLSRIENTFKANIDKDISCIDEKIMSVQKIRQGHKDALVKLEMVRSSSLDEYRHLNKKNEELNENIVKLQNAKICPTCKREVTDINHILEQIEEIKKDIAKNDVLKSEIREKGTANNKAIESIELKIREVEKEEQKYIAEKRDLNNKKSDFVNVDEYKAVVKEIADIKTKILERNEIQNKMSLEVKDKATKDSRVIEAKEKFSNLKKDISNIKGLTETLKSDIEDVKKDISDVQSIIDRHSSLEKEIKEDEKMLYQKESDLKVLDSEMSSIEIKIDEYNSGAETRNTIKALKDELKSKEVEYDSIKENISKANMNLTINKNKISENIFSINEIMEYKLVDSTMKLYKKMLGNSGIIKYIFSHVVPLMNKKMNDLLSDVNFRLVFSETDNSLKFFDLDKKVSRPMSFISGMQRTLSPLTLISVMRDLNTYKKSNILFIDEISGKLNSGKDLPYKALNYQDITKKFIQRISDNVSVYIVDHVLDFDHCRNIVVVPSETGSNIEIK